MRFWTSIYLMTAAIALGNLTSCGKTKSESKEDETSEKNTDDADDPKTGKLAVSTIDDYPLATEPVTGTKALSDDEKEKTETFDAPSGTLAVPTLELASLLAETGIPLGKSTSSDTFSEVTNASYGACEMVNRGRGFLHEAATGDQLQCDVRLMGNLPQLKDLYDGKPHVIKEEDPERGTSLLKIRIDGTKDGINGFTAHRCENGTQQLYLKTTIDPETGKYDYRAKRIGEPDNPEVDRYYADIRVFGRVDDKGDFVGLKTIDNISSNEFSGGAVSFNRYQIVQSQKNVLFQGVGQQTDRPEPSRFVSYFNLIDGNPDDEPFDLGKYAIGNGAIVLGEDGADPIIQGWLGDSRKIDGSVSQIEAIRDHADSLPTAEEPEPIQFSGEEAWDCSDEGAITLSEQDYLDGGLTEEDFAPCDQLELPQNDHLECHEIASKNSSD